MNQPKLNPNSDAFRAAGPIGSAITNETTLKIVATKLGRIYGAVTSSMGHSIGEAKQDKPERPDLKITS
jgi:hypothetical protein